MKKRKKVDRGDVIAIPIEGGRKVFAQVCWASDVFKDVIQIAFVLGRCEPQPNEPLRLTDFTLFTTALPVRKGRWQALFTHTHLHEPFPPSFHCAGGVYLGDEHLREASAAEQASLPNLRVCGSLLVEKKAAAWLESHAEDR